MEDPVIMPALTLQQLRVVFQLASGRGYKQAAFALDMSVHTVRMHIIRIASRIVAPGTPKEKVLRYADRLISAQTVDLRVRAKAA